jgi:mannonate dehydratase
LNGRELAVASYLSDHLVPLLIGRDARRIEDTWQYLYKGAYWRRGPVTMAAIAAVDTALWDIAGKTMNVPVYQLLGGASRDRVLVYAHANGKTLDDTVAAVAHHQQLGYKAIRAQCGIPGVEHAYGIAKGDAPYEPAEKGKPLETAWSTEAYLSFVPSVFERLRREFGSELHLLHDVHHRLTPIEAGRLGQTLEPYRLFWMEDPVPAELQESFRLIRQHTTTPLAVGEVFNSIFRLPPAHRRAVDRLHPDDGDACRGDQPPAEDRGAGGTASRAHRVARRHGPEPGVHGRRAHFDLSVPQLRHPGAHAARRRHRSRLSPRVFLPGRLHAPGRQAGSRRGADEPWRRRFRTSRHTCRSRRKLDGTLHSW